MSFTVRQLKELLEDLPGEMEVWLSRDEEGNGFAPMPDEEQYSIAFVKVPKWGWADDVVFDEQGTKVSPDRRKVLILWPDA